VAHLFTVTLKITLAVRTFNESFAVILIVYVPAGKLWLFEYIVIVLPENVITSGIYEPSF